MTIFLLPASVVARTAPFFAQAHAREPASVPAVLPGWAMEQWKPIALAMHHRVMDPLNRPPR